MQFVDRLLKTGMHFFYASKMTLHLFNMAFFILAHNAQAAPNCKNIFLEKGSHILKEMLSSTESAKLLRKAESVREISDPVFNKIPEGHRIRLKIGDIQKVGSFVYAVVQRHLEPIGNHALPAAKYPYALRSAVALIKDGEVSQIILESGTGRELLQSFANRKILSPDARESLKEQLSDIYFEHPSNQAFKKYNGGVSADVSEMYFLAATDLPSGEKLIRYQSTLYFNLMGANGIPMQEFASEMLVRGSLIYGDGKIRAVLPDQSISYKEIAKLYSNFANNVQLHAAVIKDPGFEGQALFDLDAKPIALVDMTSIHSDHVFSSYNAPLVKVRFGKVLPQSTRSENNFIPLEWIRSGELDPIALALMGKEAAKKVIESTLPGRLQVFWGTYDEANILSIWNGL